METWRGAVLPSPLPCAHFLSFLLHYLCALKSLGHATPELKKPAINRGIPNPLSTALAPRRRSPQSKSPNPSARADTGHIGGESAPVRRLLPVFPDPIQPPPPAAAPNRIADSRLLIFFVRVLRSGDRRDRIGAGSVPLERRGFAPDPRAAAASRGIICRCLLLVRGDFFLVVVTINPLLPALVPACVAIGGLGFLRFTSAARSFVAGEERNGRGGVPDGWPPGRFAPLWRHGGSDSEPEPVLV